MELNISEGAKRILARLESAGYTAYIAGGAVRDLLMGNSPHDYDIATNARPDEIKALFKKTIDTGIAHGTVTVIENKTGYEITTFRRDGEYSDSRHPEDVIYVNDTRIDCLRRDFTINAMMYNPKTGVIDYLASSSWRYASATSSRSMSANQRFTNHKTAITEKRYPPTHEAINQSGI